MRPKFILVSTLLCFAVMCFAQDSNSNVRCRFENYHHFPSIDTNITGINGNSSVVGFYDFQLPDGGFESRGFLRSHGDYFPIDVPFATGSTAPFTLNDRGEIVGIYVNSTAGNSQGFLLTQHGYQAISVTGFDTVRPLGINNRGLIAGTVDKHTGSDLVERGFLLKDGKVTLIRFPGSGSTDISGINDEGTMVGGYGTPDEKTFHGFVLKHGKFMTLDYPGATWTQIASINDDGLVLGTYWIWITGGPTIRNNFVWKDGTFKVLPSDGSFNCFQSKPCPNSTFYSGVNNRGQFVGSYYPSTIPPDQYTSGFVATCENLP